MQPDPLLAHLTLTHALMPDVRYYAGFNTPSWAMTVEFIFTLCFLPTVLVMLHLGTRAHRAAGAVPDRAAAGGGRDRGGNMKGIFLFYINPLARLAEFAAGALL